MASGEAQWAALVHVPRGVALHAIGIVEGLAFTPAATVADGAGRSQRILAVVPSVSHRTDHTNPLDKVVGDDLVPVGLGDRSFPRVRLISRPRPEAQIRLELPWFPLRAEVLYDAKSIEELEGWMG